MLLLVVPSALGQIVYGQGTSASVRGVYQNWKLTVDGHETTLTQSALPLALFVPVADNWEVHLTTSPSRSNLESGSLTTNLTSVSSSSIRVFHSLANDQVFVSAGMILPLGKTGLDTLEVQVAELISDDYLNTPVKQVSEGLGFVAQVGATAQANDWLMYGATASYTLNGSFTYFEGGEKYNPGDEVALQGSATATNGDAAFDVDISYRHYFTDKVGNLEVFKSGGVLAGVMTGRYNFDAFSTSLSLAYIKRNKNSILFGSSLEAEDLNSNNNKAVINGSLSYTISPQIALSLLAAMRSLSANDYATSSSRFFGKSTIYSIGGGAEYFGPEKRYSVFGRLIASSGEANKDAGAERVIDVSGFEFSLGARWRF